MNTLAKLFLYDYPLWFRWMIFTYIGITAGFVLTRCLGNSIGYPYEAESYFLGALVFVGLCSGFGQWLILQSRLKNALLWIPATVIGLIIGFLIYLPIYVFIPRDGLFTRWIDPLVTGTMLGAASGATQWLLLNKRLQGSFKWVAISALSWLIGFGISNLIFKTMLNNIYLAGLYDLVNSFLIGIPVGAISGSFVKSLISNHVGDNKD